MARISLGAGLTNNHKMTFGVISAFTLLFAVSYFISVLTIQKPEPTVKSVESFFAEFPMNFQGNDGNFTRDVKYFSKGYQFDLMFMSNEILLNLYSTETNSSNEGAAGTRKSETTSVKTKLSQVSLEFLNAETSPTIKGLSEFSPTKVSATSVIGRSSNGNNVQLARSFTEVKYSNVYPGIDVYFSGKQKQLFYEFVLSETANVDDVTLKVSGLDGEGDFEIDMHGNISVTCRGKQMQIKKPEIYRIVKQKKQPVNGYFIVTPKNEIKFRLAGDVKLL